MFPAHPAPGQSLYPLRPPDPRAVDFARRQRFAVHGDGTGDDAPALQKAIDAAFDHHDARLVFIPEGTYRLGETVQLWPGVRLVGYGRQRPVFLLAAATPGFGDGPSRYLIHCRGKRTRPGEPLHDAQNSTFFSGLSNVNIRLEDANPSAVAVRFNVAQHSSLEHVDFHLGTARAAVEQAGNEIEDCRFFGGRNAIRTGRSAASWQVLLLDCRFEGQREAAIETQHAGLTLIRCRFRGQPCAIVTPEGQAEELYLKDCRFESLSDAAVVMSEWDLPENKLNAEDLACARVPCFLRFRGGQAEVRAPAPIYAVRELSCGLHVDHPRQPGDSPRTALQVRCEPLQALPPVPVKDFPLLPPMETWVSVRDCGAAGDGARDDTAALQRAIREHPSVYVPAGRYRLTDTLVLKPDTAVIGLHSGTTLFTLDAQTPGFTDEARPKAMLTTPAGGRNLVTGVGFRPAENRGGVAVRWMAGPESCLDDVWFGWNRQATRERGRDLHACLWVASGGGTFKNIWSPNWIAATGLLVTDTETEGRAYLLSIEHHLSREVQLMNVRHWRFYALQTEENLGSEQAMALDLEGCQDVTFANLFMYRVMAIRERFPHAIRLKGCAQIHFRGLHCFSWGACPFDHAAFDEDTGSCVREREIGRLAVGTKNTECSKP